MEENLDTFKAVCIDPGGTTGIVKARLLNNELTLQLIQHKFTPYQFQFWLELHAKPPTILICEDFEFRPNSPDGLVLTPAHLIGVLMAYAEKSKQELRIQKAAYGEGGFYRDSHNLKRAGVYQGGEPYEHAMSAMRHFMQWLMFGPGYKYMDNKTVKVVLKK